MKRIPTYCGVDAQRVKNNLFEFNSKFHKQVSGATIGTKFVSPYTCIFEDHFKTEI